MQSPRLPQPANKPKVYRPQTPEAPAQPTAQQEPHATTEAPLFQVPAITATAALPQQPQQPQQPQHPATSFYGSPAQAAAQPVPQMQMPQSPNAFAHPNVPCSPWEDPKLQLPDSPEATRAAVSGSGTYGLSSGCTDPRRQAIDCRRLRNHVAKRTKLFRSSVETLVMARSGQRGSSIIWLAKGSSIANY